MKEKYQILHLTPATSPPDTLRPGRPKDPIPRGVCLAASAPFDRREARIRENNGKKSEGTPYWEGTKLLREQQKFISMSNQGWSSLLYVTYSHPELSKALHMRAHPGHCATVGRQRNSQLPPRETPHRWADQWKGSAPSVQEDCRGSPARTLHSSKIPEQKLPA